MAARRVAWGAVRRVHEGGAWAGPAVDTALSRSVLDARDRAFAANLAFETLRWEGTLDWLLGQVVHRPLGEIQPELLDILRMGAWQLHFGRVPDRAAVDTSVELARRHVGPQTAGFVNGVLRALGRAAPALPTGEGAGDVGRRLAMPEWAVDLARQRFGARAEDVLAAGNRPPGLVLRALPGTREHLLAELRASGREASAGRHPAAVAVPGGVAAEIAAVGEGRATVQDEASMWVGDAVVAAAGGDRGGRVPLVADVCAGPGGKTTGLAEAGVTVIAGDVHPGRAALVEGLAGRRTDVGARVHPVAMDAGQPALRAGGVDVVLVDAPCSGLGVVRRRPELRWRRHADDPGRLAALQLRLLRASAPLVRPGGALVYSVCTWPVVETRAVVEAFLADVPGWAAEQAHVGAGSRLDDDPGVQLAPDRDDTDGMYVAVLRRGSVLPGARS